MEVKGEGVKGGEAERREMLAEEAVGVKEERVKVREAVEVKGEGGVVEDVAELKGEEVKAGALAGWVEAARGRCMPVGTRGTRSPMRFGRQSERSGGWPRMMLRLS